MNNTNANDMSAQLNETNPSGCTSPCECADVKRISFVKLQNTVLMTPELQSQMMQDINSLAERQRFCCTMKLRAIVHDHWSAESA